MPPEVCHFSMTSALRWEKKMKYQSCSKLSACVLNVENKIEFFWQWHMLLALFFSHLVLWLLYIVHHHWSFLPPCFKKVSLSLSLSLSLCPYICHHWCRVTDAFAAADKWWDCRGGEGSSRHAPKEGRDGKELWCLYCLAWLVYESADLSLATTLIYQGNSRKGKVMSTSSPEWPGLDFPLCAGEWWWFCDFFWALCFRKKHDEFCFSVF